MEILHVIPINDLREHSSDIAKPCECQPRIEEGGFLVVHNSWDGREITERAADHAFNEGRN